MVLSIAAAAVSYGVISGIFNGNNKKVPVVMAMQDIPPNTAITKEMLVIKDIPEAYVHPQALQTVEQAIGKTSKIQLLNGQQVMTTMVASKDQPGNRFAYHVPDKLRAVTLAVNEVTGVGGFIVVGDRVDILLTRELGGIIYTSTMYQNKDILATGSMTVPTEDGKQKIVPTVTLSLSPAEAQNLTLAESTGKIKFTLRAPVDKEVLTLEAASYKK
jgi:pilus assembly protein CpaB